MAKDIRFNLRLKRNVISTVNIDLNKINKNGKRRIGDFVYVPILDLQPKFLYDYAFRNHKKGKEGQTLLIIDECQILFNPRDYSKNGRAEWILFFTKHRHLGYNIIMTSQFDRLVDRQIRSLFEYEIKHRKVNNMGILFMLPFTAFALIEYWYGVRIVVSRRIILFNKKIASIYDSYVMYDDFAKEYALEEVAEVSAEADEEPTGGTDAEMGSGGPHRRGWFVGRLTRFVKKFRKFFQITIQNVELKE